MSLKLQTHPSDYANGTEESLKDLQKFCERTAAFKNAYFELAVGEQNKLEKKFCTKGYRSARFNRKV